MPSGKKDGRIVADIGEQRKMRLKIRLERKKETLTNWLKSVADRFINNADKEILTDALKNNELRDEIKKKDEIELPSIIVGCIYGVAGIGKSTLALSAPKPLLLDTDNGIHRVQSEYRCDCVQVRRYNDILQVLFEEDLSEYQSIVIDTLG